MRNFVIAFGTLALVTASVHASVLYDSGGFESFPNGNLSDGNGWTVGVASPKPDVIDVGGDHDNVLRIYGPLVSSSNNLLAVTGQSEGDMTISFDMLTNTNFRSFNVVVAPTDTPIGSLFTNNTTSITVGRTPGLIEHFDGGSWQQVGTFTLNEWQRVDIVIHLTGDDAGTFDFLVNGESTATAVPWRNSVDVSANPLGDIWLMGQGRSEAQGGGNTSRYIQIDNLVVTGIPEPASMSLMALGVLMMVRRSR